jgi:hypothetical protein
MRNAVRVSLLMIVGLFALSLSLSAHHGAASYDTSKTITLKGTVADYVWANPHVFVKVDAKDESGNMVRWNIEAWNPVTQANRGWSKNTFKLGDEVEIETRPVKNGQPIGQFAGRIMINGKQFKLHND